MPRNLLLRWLSGLFGLLLVLVTTILPTQAAILPIDPAQPTRITDNNDIYNKIVAIRNTINTQPVSPVSPDDQSILVLGVQGDQLALAFLNLPNGALTPVKFSGLPPVVSELRWLDNQTLGCVVLSGHQFGLLRLDRATGSLKVSPLQVPATPVSLSPDGRKLIVAAPVAPAAAQTVTAQSSWSPLPGSDPFQSPFTRKINLSLGSDPTPTGSLLDKWLSPAISPLARRNIQGLSLNEVSVTSYSLGLAALDLTTGKLTPLFALPAGTIPYSLSWSADSSRLALTRTFNFGNIGQYSGGQRSLDAISQNTLGLLPPAQNPFFVGSGVDTFDFSTNTAHPALLKAGQDNTLDIYTYAAWSPDNQTLLVQLMRPARLAGRPYPVYLLGESAYLRFYNATGQLQATLDRPEISAIPINAFSAPYFISPTELIINATRESNNSLFYYNRATTEFRQLPLPDGAALLPQFTNQSRQLLFTFTSFTQAPEVFRINADGSGLYQLTGFNNDLTRAAGVRADRVSFTLASGETRTGYLLQQAGAAFPPKNVRLIVWQEGGPTGAMLNQWGDRVENPFNILPNFGFALLFVPLEGRVGFGPARLNRLADSRNFGALDIDEQAEIVQQAINQGWTQPGHIGITGCSYGGYFTTESLARHPQLYTAALSQCTLADFFTEVQFDQSAIFFYLLGETPTANPSRYTAISPLYNATKIRTATLFFHGMNDFIPIQTIANFHDQLYTNGAAVNLMAFNKEGHGLSLNANQIIAGQAEVLWFQQYLPGPLAPTSFAPFRQR